MASDLSQGCSNKSDTVMINKNVTRLTTQGCNNTAISWLYRTCWNNLVTSLIISTRLLQIVNSLFQTCYNTWEQAVRRQLVDGLLTNLLQDVRFLRVYYTRKNAQVVTSLQTSCYKSVHKLSTSYVRTACSKFVVTSLKQAVNNLQQAWWHYQPCYKTVLTSLLQPWYNKDVTRFKTRLQQSCYIKHVTDLSEQPCNKSDNFDKVVASCQQVVPNLLTTCDKQCEHIFLMVCW
jgi:hypothetical protein